MIAFDIDGIFTADVKYYDYNIKFSDYIINRQYPLFSVPFENYCLITSRLAEDYMQTVNNILPYLKIPPKIIYHGNKYPHKDRISYKRDVLRKHPEIEIFFESDIDCVKILKLDVKTTVFHWATFIEDCLVHNFFKG